MTLLLTTATSGQKGAAVAQECWPLPKAQSQGPVEIENREGQIDQAVHALLIGFG